MIKGNVFFATSPLSQGEKNFLLLFSDSSEERVLNEEGLSEGQRMVVNAQSETQKQSAQEKLQALWAKPLSLKRTLTREWSNIPPAWDHSSVWMREGKAMVAVSQPYPWLLNRELDQLDAFAKEFDWQFRISNFFSWHYPGRCWFIEWFRY